MRKIQPQKPNRGLQIGAGPNSQTTSEVNLRNDSRRNSLKCVYALGKNPCSPGHNWCSQEESQSGRAAEFNDLGFSDD